MLIIHIVKYATLITVSGPEKDIHSINQEESQYNSIYLERVLFTGFVKFFTFPLCIEEESVPGVFQHR